MTIRLLIADDHLIIRQGLRLILEGEPEFEIVGEAENGQDAVDLTAELQPDVVLMDLRMPGMDGFSAIQAIKLTYPQTAIVILTTYNEDDLMLRGLQAGAQSFLLKDTDRQTLFNTLNAAARGETLLRPDVLSRVLAINNQNAAVENAERHTRSATSGVLSQREQQVLRLVADGLRNKEIAIALDLSERTVKSYLDSIFEKLDVDSRTAAVTVALKRGALL